MVSFDQLATVESQFEKLKHQNSLKRNQLNKASATLVTFMLVSFFLREPSYIVFTVSGLALVFLILGLFVMEEYDPDSPTGGIDERNNYSCLSTILIPFAICCMIYGGSKIETNATQHLLFPLCAIISWSSLRYLKANYYNDAHATPFHCFGCLIKSTNSNSTQCPFCQFETKASNSRQALAGHVKRKHTEIETISGIVDRVCASCRHNEKRPINVNKL